MFQDWLNNWVSDGSVDFDKRHRKQNLRKIFLLTFKSHPKVIEKHGTMDVPRVKYLWLRMANFVKIILVYLVTASTSLGVQETRHGGELFDTKILLSAVAKKKQRLQKKLSNWCWLFIGSLPVITIVVFAFNALLCWSYQCSIVALGSLAGEMSNSNCRSLWA